MPFLCTQSRQGNVSYYDVYHSPEEIPNVAGEHSPLTTRCHRMAIPQERKFWHVRSARHPTAVDTDTILKCRVPVGLHNTSQKRAMPASGPAKHVPAGVDHNLRTKLSLSPKSAGVRPAVKETAPMNTGQLPSEPDFGQTTTPPRVTTSKTP